MRDIVAVCQSSGKSRAKVAQVLDRYLFRIGTGTWRGQASNQCLDRISKDLRASATRATAVIVHGFSPRQEDRFLFRIGSKRKFSPDGLYPIMRHPSATVRKSGSATHDTMRAIIRIAAMLHDIGKATVLFQGKLRNAIAGKETAPDALRHELISALVWDALTDGMTEQDLVLKLQNLKPEDIDKAIVQASVQGREIFSAARSADPRQGATFRLGFLRGTGLASAVGLLILGHHRQPMTSAATGQPTTALHCNIGVTLKPGDLDVAPGTPYWHEPDWCEKLAREAVRIGDVLSVFPLMDQHARTSLMLADHFGSASKEKGDGIGHIANSHPDGGSADSLSRHVSRVTDFVRASFDAMVTSNDAYPSLALTEAPSGVVSPPVTGRFAWQGLAASAAAKAVSTGDGGFFSCILAGTGSGKTRGAPAILAAASFNDVDPRRRRLRFTLGLGLRVLATQSGREYVEDAGFSRRDVSVLIGVPELNFRNAPEGRVTGSEDMLAHLDAVDVIRSGADVPEEGDEREADWLKGLSYDLDRGLPPFVDMLAKKDRRGEKLKRLVAAPVLCATIDNIIAAASPERSAHLAASLRLSTSDVILDEIDQYGPEDLSVVARLAWLVGASGRKLIIMSATVTPFIAKSLHDAYCKGWAAHARTFGRRDHVHALCASDVEGAIRSSAHEADFRQCFEDVRRITLSSLDDRPALRLCQTLPECSRGELLDQISRTCSRMHDIHGAEIDGFQVSVGFVRATRISHVVSLAHHFPSTEGRLRRILCLHSRFSRLHRGWIERRLKGALTRKGIDPDAPLRELCHGEGLFDQAKREGVRDIEIIVICSPVIETGNDIDFDYAVLDPSSTRSIVQSGGRVNRHRMRAVYAPNIALLARPMVTMFGDGLMSMPGVETRPAAETGVSAVSLAGFGITDRRTVDLIGRDEVFPLDARMVLCDDAHLAPLPRAEAALIGRLMDDPACAVSDWADLPLRRHGARQSRLRRFRRSTAGKILAWRAGNGIDALSWFWDAAPGKIDPITRPARNIAVMHAHALSLFPDILERAWIDLGGDDRVSDYRGRTVLGIEWETYDQTDNPDLSFAEDLGLFRTNSLDEFRPS